MRLASLHRVLNHGYVAAHLCRFISQQANSLAVCCLTCRSFFHELGERRDVLHGLWSFDCRAFLFRDVCATCAWS